MDAMKILLVDDVHLERVNLEMRLKNLQHQVLAVQSGEEALAQYQHFDPDLVILDISMPNMDGYEVAREIRERFQEWIPIVFLSSHDEPEMIAKAIENGGDDYLVKPVNKIVLGAKIHAMQRIAKMRHRLIDASVQLEAANQQLEKKVNEDGLTGIANRRYLDEFLTSQIAWHGRNGLPLTVMMLDIDHFKIFNDHYGHLKGDQCLVHVAQALQSLYHRSGELVARYGGEEFVVVLSNCDDERSQQECERLQRQIRTLAIEHKRSPTAPIVTASFGSVSWLPTGLEKANHIYQIVDKVLYQAKHQGRNCYVVAEV
ncbi:Protein-glutamate methylesterase/protein-glutamine glutaminase [Vibrio stylophorae]|uniref:diguanylate cyclase n=1 Tax=Vibrio stylophorae TaxID=659351 RepID=A0ABN8DZC4_9VIBR|nr:diguanylate cyclase [Vibrio stylophorae]CAH0535714.1 Protein-glutamate methylesterase/protein-glutamine glutaminase [Vibrio stylophorae]